MSGVVLCTSCVDEELWPRVDAWLVEHEFAPLARVDEQASGTKHPQMTIGVAGYNYFPELDFEQFVRSLPWRQPGNVVLVQQHDHREMTGVWRADGDRYAQFAALRTELVAARVCLACGREWNGHSCQCENDE